MAHPLTHLFRLSLSAKIFLGMGAGILTGLFWGEDAQTVDLIGQIFVKSLQMAILPFVMLSLMSGLGSLSYRKALSLGKTAGGFLLVLWGIALMMVMVLPLTFPQWESSRFFSPYMAQIPEKVDFLELYVPANPFFSLANGMVPAVVVFSLVVGIALIGIEHKQPLMDILSVLLECMTRVTGFVIKLAPLGVFAIAASAAGTMQFEELGMVQVYLFSYIVATLFLTFGVLPALVATLTPLTYRDIIRFARGALVTAFATGNALIILPLLTESGRDLLRRAELADQDTDSTLEVIVPASYNFPSSGLLLNMAFVPFAGWFGGTALSVPQYPKLLLSGLASFFGGSPMVAIPFLLDLFRIPTDMFELFVTVDVFTGRFGTLTAAMHMWVLGLLGSCAMAGHVTVRWNKVIGWVGGSLLVGGVLMGGSHVLFANAINPEYTKYRILVEMDLLFEPTTAEIRAFQPDDSTPVTVTRDDLEAIRQRGVLRVGYFHDSLPFSFRNNRGELVGFDVEMAHLLAGDLQVTLEFIRLSDEDMIERCFTENVCDIVMSGAVLRPDMLARGSFSQGYMDATVAFIVKDDERDVFGEWSQVRSRQDIQIGIPRNFPNYQSMVEQFVPQAHLHPLPSPRKFFTANARELDALLFLAEPGSAWTLIYPAYTVVVPLPKPIKIPLVYPMPKGEEELVEYVNAWLELKKKDGTLEAVFDHWIVGKGATEHTQRWSIIRDVLHWIE
jgi:Na+/H+-dicarboxylate symporter/ABC-type amino acid transport substrate-binding protein